MTVIVRRAGLESNYSQALRMTAIRAAALRVCDFIGFRGEIAVCLISNAACKTAMFVPNSIKSQALRMTRNWLVASQCRKIEMSDEEEDCEARASANCA